MPDLAARCFHRRKLSYQIGEECAQGTKMDKKRMQGGAHSFAFRQVHNDTSTAAILSKIAQNRVRSVRSHLNGQAILDLAAYSK
jgi:hypothetical protein